MEELSEVIVELPGDLRRLAEVAGLEAAVKIARAFRGTILYVPSLDEMMRRARDISIKRDYDGGAVLKELAPRYGLTIRRIRKILDTPDVEMPEEFIRILSNRD